MHIQLFRSQLITFYRRIKYKARKKVVQLRDYWFKVRFQMNIFIIIQKRVIMILQPNVVRSIAPMNEPRKPKPVNFYRFYRLLWFIAWKHLVDKQATQRHTFTHTWYNIYNQFPSNAHQSSRRIHTHFRIIVIIINQYKICLA